MCLFFDAFLGELHSKFVCVWGVLQAKAVSVFLLVAIILMYALRGAL